MQDTYLSAYHILRDVRESLGEFSDALVKGEDTSGAYTNTWLTRRINEAQAHIYAFLMKVTPDEFYKETTITGVSSVFTLPWDFGRMIQFRDENNEVVHPISPRSRPLGSGTGSRNRYYRKGHTLVVTQSGVSATYTLYYRRMMREIHAGKASAGGAASITLDSRFAPMIADYYNGMTIENLTSKWVDDIDDYSTARVATISETAAQNDLYGLVSELPEPFHFLISPRATLRARELHPNPKNRPSVSEYKDWTSLLIETASAFNLSEDQMDPASLWTDFQGPGGKAVYVPGHTSPVYDL